jgi:hypothetical protein
MRGGARHIGRSTIGRLVIFVVRKGFQYRNRKRVIYDAIGYCLAQNAIGGSDRFHSPGGLA